MYSVWRREFGKVTHFLQESFNHLESWLAEIQQCQGEKARKVIIGMKNDLVNQQSVSFQEAKVFLNRRNTNKNVIRFLFKEYADSLSIPMFEVSAPEHDFIDMIFKTMISYIQPGTELNEFKISNDFNIRSRYTPLCAKHSFGILRHC